MIALAWLLAGLGLLLLWCGIKGQDPREVFVRIIDRKAK